MAIVSTKERCTGGALRSRSVSLEARQLIADREEEGGARLKINPSETGLTGYSGSFCFSTFQMKVLEAIRLRGGKSCAFNRFDDSGSAGVSPFEKTTGGTLNLERLYEREKRRKPSFPTSTTKNSQLRSDCSPW
jgi:hypothetical protein